MLSDIIVNADSPVKLNVLKDVFQYCQNQKKKEELISSFKKSNFDVSDNDNNLSQKMGVMNEVLNEVTPVKILEK